MKKVFSIIVLLYACILMTGCTKKYTTDINKEYASYWKYALGDYQVSYKTEYRDHDGGIDRDMYRGYTFTFKDSKGENRIMYITNYFTDGRTFDDSLKGSIEGYICNDVDISLLEKILSEQDIETMHISKSCEIEQVDKSIKLYDDISGVKISDLSFKTLNENNLNLLIKLNIQTEEEYDFADFIQKTIPFLAELKTGNQIILNDLTNMQFEITMSPRCSGCKTQKRRMRTNGFAYIPIE